MITAKNVADFLVDASNKDIDQLKLMKLLYFAQVWHILEFRSLLFNDSIQAWEYGPVVPSVRNEVKQYGAYPVPKPQSVDYSIFNDEQIDLLTDLIVYFDDYTAGNMIDLTHEPGSPWDKAYQHGQNTRIDLLENANYHKDKHFSRLVYFFSEGGID